MVIDCVEDLSCVIAKPRQLSHTRGSHYSPCYNLINTLTGNGGRRGGGGGGGGDGGGGRTRR